MKAKARATRDKSHNPLRWKVRSASGKECLNGWFKWHRKREEIFMLPK